MKKIKLFLSMLMVMLLSVGNVWGAVVSGTTYNLKGNSLPTDWSGTNTWSATSATSYFLLTAAANYVQTDEFCQGGFTSIKVKARKYGGPASGQEVVTVSWVEKGGSAKALGTITPTSTTLTDYTISSPASVTGNKEGYIKITASSTAANGKGAGIQEVTINYTAGSCTAAEPHTVSFSTGDGNPAVSPITETSGGAGITLPAGPTPACSADGWSFAGWAAAAVGAETTTAPTLLSGTYHPTENCTLFAVYKRTEAGGGSTTKSMTSFEAISGNVENDVNVSYAAAQGTAGTAPAINNGEIRIYQNGGLLTITANNGSKLNSITIGSSMTTKVTYAVDGGSASENNDIAKNGTFTVDELDATEVVFTCTGTDKNSRLYLNNLSVTYGGGGTTYYLSAPCCCEKHAISIANNIENGSVSADLAEACEGTTVTLTFTPTTNYHLSAWTLNGAAQDVNANTFSMPAGAATISATFEQDDCDPLETPVVTVSGKAYPYDAIKLAWTAIEHADAYKVYIYDNEDNELEHNDAFAGVEYTIGQTLSASTTYKYSVQAISNTPATYCPSVAATGSFVTEALPTAHLTLIALGDEQQASGDYSILTPFELPSTAAACSKTFMGWDADPDCATIPTYAKGAEFTFQNTTGVTLYAVYADETPGEATLTKLGSEATFADGDKLVIAAKGTNFGLYFENAGSSYVKNWELEGADPVLSELTDTKKILTLVKSGDNWKFGDATNGYFYSSSSNNLEISTTNSSEFNIFSWNTTESAFTITKTDGRYLNCRTDLTSGNKNLWRFNGTNTNSGSPFLNVYKYATSASTYDNYSTECLENAETPTITPDGSADYYTTAQNVTITAEDGATIYYTTDGTTPTTGSTKYTEAISLSERGEYTIKAIAVKAGKANSDVAEAIIKINLPFANLADLVAANLASGSEVIVSFSNVMITEVYETNAGYRYGLFLNVKDKDGENDIELFYNKQGDSEQVPDTWVKNGYVSATNLVTTWTEYKGQWELAMQGANWSWENGDITYGAPKAVSSVVVSGGPTKTSYVDGEKFNPAGLTVTVNYTVGDPEVIAVTDADWEFTPERLAKGETEISVKATYNTVQSAAFNVTGLTVGDIQLKTVAEFIAAGNADMRCYLEGIVSDIETGSKLKYGNFNLTDASGTIYVYGCLNQAGEAEHFEDLDVHNGDKIKVIAEDYDYYNTKHEAKNVVFVSKKPVATMTFDPMAMETGDVETMAPKTITEAEASAVVYSIKEGSDDCVSLDGAQITATAAGTATIVATLAETTAYVGTTAEFTVTVTAPDTRKIANASAFEAISGDMTPTDIKFEAFKGDGTNAPVLRSSDNPVAIRLYKPATTGGTGNYLTLTAKVGCTIDQVQITFSGNADAAYCKDDEALPTEKYITSETVLLTPAALNAQSVSIVNLKNGSIDVNAIKVWYNGEPLPIDHYFLGGSYPTEFEQYGAFDYTGLQVFAAYDVQETITEEIFDFTAEADLMTAGNKKAEVYRGEDKIAEYDITVTESPKQNPALAYTPSEETITLGDAWSAPEFSNPLNVDGITFSTSNNKVAKVTSAGVITLEGGCGTAVITASFEATEAYVASEATYTITVNEPAENLAGKWEIVTEVLPGMRIIIANEASAGAVKTMGMQNSNNRAAVASIVDGDGILTPANGTKTFLVVETETEGQYALRALNGNYIYAASSSSNNLKEQATINGNAMWSFSFAEDGVATIKANGSNSRNLIRYNSGSDIFSCYASGQSDVYVYAWKPYTRTVSGNYGTICLPNGGVLTNGALYEIAEMDYLNDKPNKIYFDEVEGGVMVAGKPYIFKPNDGETTLRVVYTDAVNAPAGDYKGLYGKYTKTPLAKDDGNYILKNNQYYYVDSENVYCDANRAYIKLAEVPEYDSSKPSYSRRRIALNVNNEQVATGMENVQGDNVQCTKVLIDGQLFIIRGEKMFDAKGQLVK